MNLYTVTQTLSRLNLPDDAIGRTALNLLLRRRAIRELVTSEGPTGVQMFLQSDIREIPETDVQAAWIEAKREIAQEEG